MVLKASNKKEIFPNLSTNRETSQFELLECQRNNFESF